MGNYLSDDYNNGEECNNLSNKGKNINIFEKITNYKAPEFYLSKTFSNEENLPLSKIIPDFIESKYDIIKNRKTTESLRMKFAQLQKKIIGISPPGGIKKLNNLEINESKEKSLRNEAKKNYQRKKAVLENNLQQENIKNNIGGQQNIKIDEKDMPSFTKELRKALYSTSDINLESIEIKELKNNSVKSYIIGNSICQNENNEGNSIKKNDNIIKGDDREHRDNQLLLQIISNSNIYPQNNINIININNNYNLTGENLHKNDNSENKGNEKNRIDEILNSELINDICNQNKKRINEEGSTHDNEFLLTISTTKKDVVEIQSKVKKTQNLILFNKLNQFYSNNNLTHNFAIENKKKNEENIEFIINKKISNSLKDKKGNYTSITNKTEKEKINEIKKDKFEVKIEKIIDKKGDKLEQENKIKKEIQKIDAVQNNKKEDEKILNIDINQKKEALNAVNIDGNHLKELDEKRIIKIKKVSHQTSSVKEPIIMIASSLQKDIRKVYKFKEQLGGGHFGTVRKAYKRDCKDSTQFYAIKSISKKNLTEKDFDDLVKEVDIISCLDHPNIIKFYETYHDQSYFHIVMELCKGKEVFDKIMDNGYMEEKKVVSIIQKVLLAIAHCHSRGVAHRDLKPENILFATNKPDAEIKLIDFGLSMKYAKDEKMHTILGTPYYVAPEVLKGEYDEKCDIWSIGAMTYLMLCGEPPYKGSNNNEIFKKIVKDGIKFNILKWKDVSNDAKDFVKNCLNKDPNKRPAASMALNHPWFANVLRETHSVKNLRRDILLNIKNFKIKQKFKQMIMKYLLNSLSEDEVKVYKSAFFAMDFFHNGCVEPDELKKAFNLTNIDFTNNEISHLYKILDQNLKGALDYTEFLMAGVNQKDLFTLDKLDKAFLYFDINKSGSIEQEDLNDALLRMGRECINPNDINSLLFEVLKTIRRDDIDEDSIEYTRVPHDDFLKIFEEN